MLDDKTKAKAMKRVARMPSKRVGLDVRESIVTDFANDMHPKAIAKKHKVSLTTVYKWVGRLARAAQ